MEKPYQRLKGRVGVRVYQRRSLRAGKFGPKHKHSNAECLSYLSCYWDKIPLAEAANQGRDYFASVFQVTVHHGDRSVRAAFRAPLVRKQREEQWLSAQFLLFNSAGRTPPPEMLLSIFRVVLPN